MIDLCCRGREGDSENPPAFLLSFPAPPKSLHSARKSICAWGSSVVFSAFCTHSHQRNGLKRWQCHGSAAKTPSFQGLGTRRGSHTTSGGRKRKLAPGKQAVKIKGLHREVYWSRRERIKYWCIDRCSNPARVSFCLCNNDLKCHFLIKTLRQELFCVFDFYLFLPANSILHVVHTVHHTFIPSESADGRKSKSTGEQRGQRLHLSSGTADLYLPRENQTGKMSPKFLPAGVWINSSELCTRWKQRHWIYPEKMFTKGNKAFDYVCGDWLQKKPFGRCADIKISKEITHCNHAATG